MTIFMSHLHRNSRICLDYSSLHFSNYFVHLIFNTHDSRQILALEWQTVIALGFVFCKIFEIKILHRNKNFLNHFCFINSCRILTFCNLSVLKFPALQHRAEERMLNLLLLVHIFTSLKTRRVWLRYSYDQS